MDYSFDSEHLIGLIWPMKSAYSAIQGFDWVLISCVVCIIQIFRIRTLRQGWPSEQILLIGSKISGLEILADRIGPELKKMWSDRRPDLKFADRIGDRIGRARILTSIEKMRSYWNKVWFDVAGCLMGCISCQKV
jgi:hypothetical protein